MKGTEATERERGRAREPEGRGEGREPSSGVLEAEKWGDSKTHAWGTKVSMSPLSLLLRPAPCVAAGETLRRCSFRGRC